MGMLCSVISVCTFESWSIAAAAAAATAGAAAAACVRACVCVEKKLKRNKELLLTKNNHCKPCDVRPGFSRVVVIRSALQWRRSTGLLTHTLSLSFSLSLSLSNSHL